MGSVCHHGWIVKAQVYIMVDGWCTVLYIFLGHDRYALILAGLVMRVLMTACLLFSLSLPTQENWYNGEVPCA